MWEMELELELEPELGKARAKYEDFLRTGTSRADLGMGNPEDERF